MIQALKDRLGLTEAVEQTREALQEQYDHYPEGIEKLRLDTEDRIGTTVDVHLEEPFDWTLMEEVAYDIGLDPEYDDGDAWFGFYKVEEYPGGATSRAMAGNIRNDCPTPVNSNRVADEESGEFRFDVLVRYLNKRYSDGD